MCRYIVLYAMVSVWVAGCDSAPRTSRRDAERHQLKHVLLVISEYAAAHDGTMSSATTDTGKLSWRVAILEKSDEHARTKGFDFESEWDSPSNAAAAVPTPKLFRSEVTPNALTRLLAVRGPSLPTASLPFTKAQSIIDDTLVVSVNSDAAVQWWRPTDLSRNDLPKLIADRKIQLLGLSYRSVVDVEKINE